MKRILLCGLIWSSGLSLTHATIAGGADKLINQVDPGINIGIEVVDLATGTVLFQRNQQKTFTPASNMKLFSDAAALMVLGPDYRFKNQLSISSAQLKDGVLQGALYLQLPGDPSFSRERLAELFSSLKNWHISRIKGNVIIDSSHASVSPYAPGWMVNDLAYSYGAPLAPLMIDANRMTVTVNPADKPGEKALIEVGDDTGLVILDNQVITKEKGAKCGVDFSLDNQNNLSVKGCVATGQWAVVQQLAIRNPLAYAQSLVRQLLSNENIVLEGQVVLGKAPEGNMLISTDTSKPVAQLMADTLKPSDNLYADSLFLHAANKLNGSPLNWNEAQPVIKKFLQEQTGIDLQKAVLTDGSGLSRDDLLTPEQTTSLLRFLYDRFPLSYEYIAALPVSGRDGTLQRRFKKPDQQDLVRAKTGTMTGVISLSGYLYTANAHTLAFAIFINKLPDTPASVSGRYRYLVDALCAYFLQQKPGNNTWAKVFAPHSRVKFQLNPTQAEQQRGRQAKWRRLESVVRLALAGQPVTVIYRNNELILRDRQGSASPVFSVLQTLRKKYPFSAALSSKTKPDSLTAPLVLWMDKSEQSDTAGRVWIIREAAS